jgi:hypothetical protein
VGANKLAAQISQPLLSCESSNTLVETAVYFVKWDRDLERKLNSVHLKEKEKLSYSEKI